MGTLQVLVVTATVKSPYLPAGNVEQSPYILTLRQNCMAHNAFQKSHWCRVTGPGGVFSLLAAAVPVERRVQVMVIVYRVTASGGPAACAMSPQGTDSMRRMTRPVGPI
jgi:hypothetical protein